MLVTEDDAQNGPDHIDAHRTVSYAISPYTQRRRVDHTHYHTAAMVATIEDLLGMPPMTIVDQRATRMWPAFNRDPNYATYEAQKPLVTPFGAEGVQLNEDTAPLARASASWNFEIEDATPEIPLNEAIWKSIKGRDSEMPAPRHDRIIGQRPVDVDERSRRLARALQQGRDGDEVLRARVRELLRQLLGRVERVDRRDDAAERGDRVEGDDVLRQVRAVERQHVALPKAAPREPGRRRAHRARELRVGQDAPARAVDERGLVGVLRDASEDELAERDLGDFDFGERAAEDHLVTPR
jgi:hypothetical protein